MYNYYIKYNNITYYIVIIISNNGRGPYSIHFMNQAAGRSKFDQGPHLARGPDFGHAWSTGFLVQLTKIFFTSINFDAVATIFLLVNTKNFNMSSP